MGGYSSEKYNLRIKSLYEVFNCYTEEELNISLETFQNAFNSIKLLRKKYGYKYDGTNVPPFQTLTFMEEKSLISFLSRVDLRTKCVSYLLKKGETKERIINLFKGKDDSQISLIIRDIVAKIDGTPKIEEVKYETKEQIIEGLNTSEDEIIEALSLIEDNDIKMSFIYTFGIKEKKLTPKEITKELEITKNKYEKYITSTTKELPRLIEKLRHKKEFRKRQLELKKQEEKNNEIITEEFPKIITKKVKEHFEEVSIEIIEEPKKEEKNEPVEESIPQIEETPSEASVEVKEEIITPQVEEEPKEEIVVPQEEKTTEPKIDDNLYTLLVGLLVSETTLEEIEESNIDSFSKAVLSIAYFDSINNKKAANLYINYLQERYKNNIKNINILNSLMLQINGIKKSFDPDVYESLLNEKEIKDGDTSITIEPQEEIKEKVEESIPQVEEIPEVKEEVIEESKEEVTTEEIEEPQEELETPIEEVQNEITEIVDATPVVEDIIVIYEKPIEQNKNFKIEKKSKPKKEVEKKKHVKTIKDDLYENICTIERELYKEMQNPERQHKAAKAWDILETITCRPASDKEAYNKVIALLERLDNETTPEHIKGLKFPSKYNKK